MSTTKLAQALTELRESLSPVRLPLPLPGSAEQTVAIDSITHQLDDYVLPRLATNDAPLLVVVGGSTGAGKSTVINALIGRVVSVPGVNRPTTKSPVLVHHPGDAHWFEDDRILPGLIRSRVSSNDWHSLQLVAEDTLPPGLAVLDSPDIDSVVKENRKLASQLLQAADLWLFTTSAARYADAVPWDYLLQAAERSTAVAVLLNRVPPGAMEAVPAHLGQLMVERGLAESPLFAVPETETDEDGLLPDAAVSPIRNWLATLAADEKSRQRVVMQTLDGAIVSAATRAPAVADAVQEQTEALEQLRSDAAKSYAEAARLVSVQSADGTLMRGEVLARWHEFVGTGEFMRAMEERLSWFRDRVWGALRGAPAEADQVKVAVESGLEALIREEGQAAAERSDTAWRATPAGRAVLRDLSADDLSRASADFPAKAARAIRDWQGDVLELVSGEGMGKRSRARVMALGVNGMAAALMVVVFAHTGGLTGAEVGIAGGTTVVAQRLLEAVFGDDAVRKLAERAKRDLDARVESLMATELARYEQALSGLSVSDGSAERIREAAEVVSVTRLRGYEPERSAIATGSSRALPPAEGADASTPTSRGTEAALDAPPALAAEVQFNQVSNTRHAEVVEAEIVEEDN